jgi:hypothetical protein
MDIDQSNKPANLDPPQPSPRPPALWRRQLAVATAIVFLIPSAFPVTAGLSNNTVAFPEWWGILDVGIVFVLAILAFVIQALARGNMNKQAEDASYHVYRILTHGILAILVVFFLFGDRIVWLNCLPGFAWRTWLLLYSLPAWFTVLGTTMSLSGISRDT